jgi:hypothetical protein
MHGTLMADNMLEEVRLAGSPGVAVLEVRSSQERPDDPSWRGLVELIETSFDAVRFEIVADDVAMSAPFGFGASHIDPVMRSDVSYDLAVVMIRHIEDVWSLAGASEWRLLAKQFVLVHHERPAADPAIVDTWALTALLEGFELIVTTDASLFASTDAHVIEMGLAIDGSMSMVPIDGERPCDLLVPGHVGLRRRRLLTEWAERTGRTCEIVDDPVTGRFLPPAELHERMTRAKFVLLDDPLGRDLLDRSSIAIQRREHGHAPGVAIVDALAAGCGVVGRLPVGGPVRRVFGHLPALFDLGPSPRDLPAEIDQLAADSLAFGVVSAQHRAEALRRHDIAHRVLSIFLTLDAAVPDHLVRRISALDALATATVDRAQRRLAAGPGPNPPAAAAAPLPARPLRPSLGDAASSGAVPTSLGAASAHPAAARRFGVAPWKVIARRRALHAHAVGS